MDEIYIGSTNPAKIAAVQSVFTDAQVLSEEVPTSVSPQPLSDEETKQGAVNRAVYLITNNKNVSLGIGLEGGVIDSEEGMFLCNWGALAVKGGGVYTAGGARIPLPDDIAAKIRAGNELGDVIDQWAEKTDVRKKEGTIGILTAGEITRELMFEHIVRLLYGQWKFSRLRSEE
ncbi:DUF84 family protein [Evansella sp. LMS18]|uniref:DUF84 family protein n=1 Tax=Evansella sp. LMS18 TaxID=2924033 RepID=UPI0020D11B4C|nr:DUF84 family protein [Evansella sp. LMS18]UTR11431.1 DUF84 family protein [Evansella sp. LMS18]